MSNCNKVVTRLSNNNQMRRWARLQLASTIATTNNHKLAKLSSSAAEFAPTATDNLANNNKNSKRIMATSTFCLLLALLAPNYLTARAIEAPPSSMGEGGYATDESPPAAVSTIPKAADKDNDNYTNHGGAPPTPQVSTSSLGLSGARFADMGAQLEQLLNDSLQKRHNTNTATGSVNESPELEAHEVRLAQLLLAAKRVQSGATSGDVSLGHNYRLQPSSSTHKHNHHQNIHRVPNYHAAQTSRLMESTAERKRRMPAPTMAGMSHKLTAALDQLDAMQSLGTLLNDDGISPGRSYKPRSISTARGFGKRSFGSLRKSLGTDSSIDYGQRFL